MQLDYKQGSIDDIEAVFRLNRTIFDESWSKDVMLQSLQVGYDVFVCYAHGELVAYVLSQDILYETQVMQLGVRADYRRVGIGKTLMRMLLHVKKDYDKVMLEVRSSNMGAQDFYASLGFEVVGQRPNYYAKTKTKPREDAMLLSLTPQ